MKSVKHRTNVVVANSAGAAMGSRVPSRKEAAPISKRPARPAHDNRKGWISESPRRR